MLRSQLIGLGAALAIAPSAAWAAKPDACEPRPTVSVQIAPLELADPPIRPERYYPEAARQAGATGDVTLECEAANGALGQCAVDDETPQGQGFSASALKLAKTLVVRTAAVGQIVKVEVTYDIAPAPQCAPK